MIPERLRNENIKFCKLLKNTKKPFEKDWFNKPYSYNEIEEHIKLQNNYGVLCGYGGLIVIDADNSELKEYILKTLPETFMVKTGNNGTHFYYFCKDLKKKIVLTKNNIHYGEVQSYGAQVVGANSIHPNGNKYEVINDKDIATINKEQLIFAIKPFMKDVIDEEEKVLKELKKYGKYDINTIRILDIINIPKLRKASNGEYYGANPWHGSTTGMNFWINPHKNVAYCFRCNAGINVAKAIALNNNIITNCSDKLNKEQFLKVLEIARDKYGLKTPDTKINIFPDKQEQAKEFEKFFPIFYDKAGNFWRWNNTQYCWEIVDEVDILNMVKEKNPTKVDIVNSKERTEIINALKQEGRKRIPLNIKKTWIQFKNKIVDIENDTIIDASPQYFVTNPIPWELGETDETPTMDRIFTEWVGKENVKLLYEIIAYCLLPDYPIHRIFCLVGSGLNGKTSFLSLLKKFIGKRNTTATELDVLLESRFESVKLYKKLVCLMGETNFNLLTKTSILKRLVGQDLIGFEFKNKIPFDDENYAKILIATNSLPMTSDKTIGFYRRWIIIDFPNKFSEKKEIINEIPEEEFKNLARKSIKILKELLTKREFTNEGTIEEKEAKFEEKSNPITKFLKEKTENDPNGFIYRYEFAEELNTWLSQHSYRNMQDKEIARIMKTQYLTRVCGEKKYRAWIGLRWKNNIEKKEFKNKSNNDKVKIDYFIGSENKDDIQ